MAFLAHLCKIVAVYFLVGPLVGLVVFAAGVSVLGWLHGPPDAIWLGPFIAIYGTVFAHFVGGMWALLAGVVAALVAWGLKRAPFWIGLASGLVSFVVALLTGYAKLPEPPGSPIGQQLSELGPEQMVLVFLTHALAAVASWSIARCFVRRTLEQRLRPASPSLP